MTCLPKEGPVGEADECRDKGSHGFKYTHGTGGGLIIAVITMDSRHDVGYLDGVAFHTDGELEGSLVAANVLSTHTTSRGNSSRLSIELDIYKTTVAAHELDLDDSSDGGKGEGTVREEPRGHDRGNANSCGILESQGGDLVVLDQKSINNRQCLVAEGVALV